MSNSYFFLQADKNQKNSDFIDTLEGYSREHSQQVYVINKPLGENKYSYHYTDSLILLLPKHKIIILDFGNNDDQFLEYVDDFIEDLGFISDRYRYKDIIGRPRSWRKELVFYAKYAEDTLDIASFLSKHKIEDGAYQKKCELLISLLTGSINDIDTVKGNVPDNLLDKVKQKILLFDGDQTRFIYQKNLRPRITIQGLSGTGKTELLLHKLREIYVGDTDSRIMFTCHNKILANSLRKRIPEFFNFMKVEQQIKWDERLWCVNAWGSGNNKDSGAYAYICNFYNLPFFRFSQVRSFDKACELALQELEQVKMEEYAFDFMLIDESQDFPESFFELCEKVTKHTIYIAGDIFQSIFDRRVITSIEPDFLLGKCYRTDPRTLMFAHALGMGLFESPKLRWLEDNEWRACGYIFDKDNSKQTYRLRREPLRRFEDLESEEVTSMELVKISHKDGEDSETRILEIIGRIRDENPTVLVDDIGIIFIDNTQNTYLTADKLELSVPRKFDWIINKAYESKEKIKDSLFVSNKNNVKGLEFPFVICVSKKIRNSKSYRNALYMMLTRSFIKSYLLISEDLNQNLYTEIEAGLNKINTNGYMDVTEPSEKEKIDIRTTIKYNEKSESHYDFLGRIFDELGIPSKVRKSLTGIVQATVGKDCFIENEVREVIEFNYDKMTNSGDS